MSEVLPIPFFNPIIDPPNFTLLDKPIITYQRRPRSTQHQMPDNVPIDLSPVTVSSSDLDPPADPDNLPIALRKGNRSTRNPYPIYNFLSYHRLNTSHHAFVSALSSVSISKTVQEALSDPR